MNYPTYANNSQFYMQNLQDMRDRIDNQIRNYQQNQAQQPVTQPITQNFQLAPNPTNNELEAKYVDNIEAVKNTFVIKTGIFLNKDFSTLWVKDVTGKIRTFTTEEIIEMDEKDKEIYMLKQELENMKLLIKNSQDNNEIKENNTKNTNKTTKK
jgi:hypothetical protein